jgi:glycosyltransferase involved in cell wall biosynthesis
VTTVRVALAYPDLVETTSLGRETLLIASILDLHGAEVHLYQRPGAPRAGYVQHAVGHETASSTRVGGAAALGQWAWEAHRAIRRNRSGHDVVCAVGTATWEHDLVRVHAVVRAEQKRWPERGGRGVRAARMRAALAPALRPHVGVERAIQRAQFRRGLATGALAVTDEVADDLVGLLNVDSRHIEVIPCLIDHEKFAAVARHPGTSEGTAAASRLLFIGNDFSRKGLASAIRAMPLVAGHLRLVVVGGDDPGPYRQLASNLGVAERIEFVGSTATPERFYERAAMLLAPTSEDVWGMALVEAMAAGVPVIASRAAGAAPFVERAGAGIVVDLDDDSRSLARAVTRVVEDRPAAAAMSDAGRSAAAAYHRSACAALIRAFESRARKD